MSKSKPTGKRRVRRNRGQIALYALSFVLVLSMAIGYVLIAAPPQEPRTATPTRAPVVASPAPGASGVPVAPSPTATATPTPSPN